MTVRKIFTTTMPDGRQAELYGKEVGDLEIYVDGAWGITASPTGVKINFFTVTPTEEANERREVVARLVMSLNVFFQLREFLDIQCKKLEEGGMVVQVDRASLVEAADKSKE